jgi:hypothetical protein
MRESVKNTDCMTEHETNMLQISWEFECSCEHRVGGFQTKDAAFEAHAEHAYDSRERGSHSLIIVEGVI